MDKKIFQSKTFWMQVLGLVAVMVPQSASFIAEHLGASGAIWAVVNVVLRLVTKEKVQIL